MERLLRIKNPVGPIAASILLGSFFFALAYWFPLFWPAGFLIFIPLFYVIEYAVAHERGWKFFLAFGLAFGFFEMALVAVPWYLFDVATFAPYANFRGTSWKTLLPAIIFADLIFRITSAIVFSLLGLLRKYLSVVSFYLLAFPFAWLVLEATLRVFMFGMDVVTVGAILITPTWLRQLGALGGVPALSAFLAFINGAFFLFLIKKMTRRVILSTATVLVFAMGYGVWAATSFSLPPPVLKIALLQGGTLDETNDVSLDADPNYRDLVQEALRRDADVIVFPGQRNMKVVTPEKLTQETISFIEEPELQKRVVVFGAPVRTNGLIHSALVAIQKSKVVGVYYKRKLMPISEYRPRDLLGMLFPQDVYGRFSPAINEDIPFIPSLGMDARICNEEFYPSLAFKDAEKDGRILLYSGSDAAFAKEVVFRSTLRIVQLRAVQTRKWLFRATKTGISAVIDPRGNVVAQLPKGAHGLIVFPAP